MFNIAWPVPAISTGNCPIASHHHDVIDTLSDRDNDNRRDPTEHLTEDVVQYLCLYHLPFASLWAATKVNRPLRVIALRVLHLKYAQVSAQASAQVSTSRLSSPSALSPKTQCDAYIRILRNSLVTYEQTQGRNICPVVDLMDLHYPKLIPAFKAAGYIQSGELTARPHILADILFEHAVLFQANHADPIADFNQESQSVYPAYWDRLIQWFSGSAISHPHLQALYPAFVLRCLHFLGAVYEHEEAEVMDDLKANACLVPMTTDVSSPVVHTLRMLSPTQIRKLRLSLLAALGKKGALCSDMLTVHVDPATLNRSRPSRFTPAAERIHVGHGLPLANIFFTLRSCEMPVSPSARADLAPINMTSISSFLSLSSLLDTCTYPASSHDTSNLLRNRRLISQSLIKSRLASIIRSPDVIGVMKDTQTSVFMPHYSRQSVQLNNASRHLNSMAFNLEKQARADLDQLIQPEPTESIMLSMAVGALMGQATPRAAAHTMTNGELYTNMAAQEAVMSVVMW